MLALRASLVIPAEDGLVLSKLSKTRLKGQATWIESQESFTPSELFGNGSLSQESMLPHRLQTAFHGIVSVSGALEAAGCRLQTETSASAMTALGCVFESFEAGIRDWLCAVALMLPLPMLASATLRG